jgi:hypothetical protein
MKNIACFRLCWCEKVFFFKNNKVVFVKAVVKILKPILTRNNLFLGSKLSLQALFLELKFFETIIADLRVFISNIHKV